MGNFYLNKQNLNVFILFIAFTAFLSNNLSAQCVGTDRNESNLVSSLSNPNDLTFKQVPNTIGSGVGANSRKIYSGITNGETYSFYLNTNNQNVNCSRIRFLNNSNSPIGGAINIARGNGVATDNFTQLTAPAGATRIELTTSGTWTTTSALLNYKKNLTTCSYTWYDSGGSGSNYGNNEVSSITFYPATPGQKIRVNFSQFSTEDNYDALMIYNGNSTSAPLISSGLGAGSNTTTCPAGSWRGTGSPGTISSTAADGSLTFVFRSDGAVTSTGWTASVTCVPPPQYVAEIISADFGSSVWCAGETRDVNITIKNTGSAAWGPEINVGLRWNGVWGDHYVRVPGNGLASGQTATYTLPISAKNATAGPNYGSDLAPGTYNLSADIVKEGCFWFRFNSGPGGSCGEAGPGNSEFFSSAITITNSPPTGVSAGSGASICPNENITLSGSVNPISGSQTFGPFTTSGIDANNITASGTISGLPSNAVITSINWDASIGNTCTSWYFYRLFVNGSQNGNNRCNLSNQTLSSLNGQIANGNTLMIRAYDNDDWSDAITLSLTFTVNYEIIPSVSWSGGPIASGGSTLNPTVNPNSTTTYTMTATNNGCSVSDDVTVNLNTSSTAPTSISGISTICNGSSTTLTTNGGIDGTGAVDVWYQGNCNETFTDEFGTLNYSTVGSTVNSVDGVLNITSTTGDPMINMFGIGSFNPNIYKFINVRYRVLSGNAGNCEIFFNNPTYPVPSGPDRVAGALNSDGNWHILSLDMSSNSAWDDGNITGWRFDYVTTSGVNIEIDFISLSESRIIGEGSSINVSPTTNTTYSTAKKDECGTTSCVSKSITVVGQPQSPTTATKLPNVAGVCEGSSITLSGSASGGNAGVSCEIQYRYSTNGGSSWTTTGTTIPNFNSIANGNNIIQARRASCQSGCNSSVWSTVASWAVTAPPSAGTLSGNQTICASGSTTFTSTVNGGTWSSSNTNVATINASTGVISGVAAGTATMTYTVTGSGGCANATATRTVTITAPPNAGTLSGTQAICASGSTTFNSSVNGGTWSSSNTNVATINTSTGLINGVAAGIATMTYTVTGSGGCANATATRTVTVTAPPNAGTLSGTQAICASGSTTFNSSVNGGTWSSSNTNVATINASTGAISGVAAGTATMTYTVTGTGGCSNATATRTVTVTAAPDAGTLSGTNEICASGSTTFNSSVNGGTWSSSNTNVATINASTGVISGVTAGTATMTYTVTGSGGCANATATRAVTVSAPLNAGTISGDNDICLGESIQFSINGNDNGTWQSTPSGTSTISTNGNFTASQSGTYEVFYAVDNENACGIINSNSITVAVNAPSSEIAIDFSDQQLSIEVGDYIWSGQNDGIAQQLSNWYQKVAEDAYIIPTQFPSASDRVFVVPFEVASSCVIESNNPILGGNTTFEAKDFIVAENATFEMNPNSILNVTENFIVRGSFDAGSGKVVFTGTGEQWIEGEGLTFYDLEVDKAAGEVKLMNNISVDHQVIMTDGDFKLESKVLDLGLTGELINERPESRIYCLCPEGHVRVERNITAQTEAFNPGNIGLIFTTRNKELGNTVITRRNEPGVVLNDETSIVAIDRIYDVTPSANNGNLQLTLEVEYFQPEVSNLQVEETFQVFRRGSGTNDQWQMKNVSERNPSSNNNGKGKLKLENWNQFSEVAIGEEDPMALPVDFLGMDITCLDHAAGLTWKTASELNSSHFTIQRSKDGETWETIETVPAQGTTQNTTTYNFEDPSFYRNQIGYYRLRQIDFDGVATIYGPYAVLCEGTPEEFKLYPNPTSSNTTARFYWNNNSTVATLQLTDMTGKIISILEKQVSKGINEVEINTSHLTKGVYRITILHDGVTQDQGKLVKN